MILENEQDGNTAKRRVPGEARIIGRNLRNLRKRAGLTQKETAYILGITFQQVQKYERGENRFPVEKLYTLKNHFDVPYQAFFTGLASDKPQEEGWPEDVCTRLAQISNPDLQGKIKRVVAIMLE